MRNSLAITICQSADAAGLPADMGCCKAQLAQQIRGVYHAGTDYCALAVVVWVAVVVSVDMVELFW